MPDAAHGQRLLDEHLQEKEALLFEQRFARSISGIQGVTVVNVSLAVFGHEIHFAYYSKGNAAHEIDT